MEFNLIPPEQQVSSWSFLVRQVNKKLAALLIIALFVVIAVSTAFQLRALREQERFTDQAFPIQQHIMRQNALEQKLQELKERYDTAQIKRLHWPEILVCLADTKPDGAAVEKIEVRQHALLIYGTTNTTGAERKWQDTLKQRPSVRSVLASRMKSEGSASEAAFQLEVEWAYDAENTSRQKV